MKRIVEAMQAQIQEEDQRGDAEATTNKEHIVWLIRGRRWSVKEMNEELEVCLRELKR